MRRIIVIRIRKWTQREYPYSISQKYKRVSYYITLFHVTIK